MKSLINTIKNKLEEIENMIDEQGLEGDEKTFEDLQKIEEEISLEIEQEQDENKIQRLNSLLNKTIELKNRVNEDDEDDMLDMMYPNKEEDEEHQFDD